MKHPFDITAKEAGASSLLLAVFFVAGFLMLLLCVDFKRSQMKAKEVIMKTAITNAQQSNMSAISYLHASLESTKTVEPLLTVEDKRIVGKGNSHIVIGRDGSASYRELKLADASEAQRSRILSGLKPKSGSLDDTKLEIVETQKVFHNWIYVVRATTMAKHGHNEFSPVSSIGRIKITPANAMPEGPQTFMTCPSCLEGANQLSLLLGYVADIKNSVNMGFYKVAASSNLCDIHFLKNLADPLEDHEAVSSVLKTQIAVYCPCDCALNN